MATPGEGNSQPITVTVKRLNFLANWAYCCSFEHCPICKASMTDSCIICQVENNPGDCAIVWGACNHSFHLHCMTRFMKTNVTCPMCAQPWEVTAVQSHTADTSASKNAAEEKTGVPTDAAAAGPPTAHVDPTTAEPAGVEFGYQNTDDHPKHNDEDDDEEPAAELPRVAVAGETTFVKAASLPPIAVLCELAAKMYLPAESAYVPRDFVAHILHGQVVASDDIIDSVLSVLNGFDKRIPPSGGSNTAEAQASQEQDKADAKQLTTVCELIHVVEKGGAGDQLRRALNSKWIQTREYTAAIILSKFINSILSEQQELSHCCCRYLVGALKFKDVFQEHYRMSLAKRLLSRTSDKEMEKVVLQELEAELGRSFTHKFFGMIQDIEKNTELQDKFDAFLNKHPLESSNVSTSTPQQWPAEVSVQLLCRGQWPIFPKFHPPAAFYPYFARYLQFYRSLYQNKRQVSCCFNPIAVTAVAVVDFPSGRKEMRGDFFQIAIINELAQQAQAFSEKKVESAGLTVEQLSNKLFGYEPSNAAVYGDRPSAKTEGKEENIPPEHAEKWDLSTCTNAEFFDVTAAFHARRQKSNEYESKVRSAVALLSLHPQFRLLGVLKEGFKVTTGTKDDLADDKTHFALNPEFKIKVRKFTLPKMQPKPRPPSPGPSDLAHQIVVDAAIVRWGKRKGTFSITELFEALPGCWPWCDQKVVYAKSITKAMIKQRLDSLIAREYFERSADSQDQFKYKS